MGSPRRARQRHIRAATRRLATGGSGGPAAAAAAGGQRGGAHRGGGAAAHAHRLRCVLAGRGGPVLVSSFSPCRSRHALQPGATCVTCTDDVALFTRVFRYCVWTVLSFLNVDIHCAPGMTRMRRCRAASSASDSRRSGPPRGAAMAAAAAARPQRAATRSATRARTARRPRRRCGARTAAPACCCATPAGEPRVFHCLET